MVVPASSLDGSMTITEIAFERVPMGGSSALLYNFTMSLGEAGGEELGRRFEENLVQDSTLKIVYSGSRVTAGDNGEGRISFVLDTPYEYTGGNLLVDFSFSNIEGSVYAWTWNAEGNRYLSGNTVDSAQGTVSSTVPVIVITGE